VLTPVGAVTLAAAQALAHKSKAASSSSRRLLCHSERVTKRGYSANESTDSLGT
jgi:hypothetical protein